MTACKKRWLLKHCVQYASTSLHPVYISVFVSRYVVGGFVTVLYLGYLSLFHVMLSGVLQLYFTLVICLCFTLCCQRFCRCTLLWLSVFVSRYVVRGFVAVLYLGYRSLFHVMLSEVLQLYFTLVIGLCFTLCCQRFCSCTLPWYLQSCCFTLCCRRFCSCTLPWYLQSCCFCIRILFFAENLVLHESLESSLKTTMFARLCVRVDILFTYGKTRT